jgi:methionine synthase II (cobalamin-independent)
MSSIGTPFVSLSSHRIEELLTGVLSGISGIKGVHCCGNTEWPLLLRTPIDILSFDAYNYADSFSTYTAEVKLFLERGSAIAWGIVPNDEEILSKESVSSIRDRLEEAMAPFTREGMKFRQLIEQGLLTPSCGMAMLSKESTEQALGMLAELSDKIRKRYM